MQAESPVLNDYLFRPPPMESPWRRVLWWGESEGVHFGSPSGGAPLFTDDMESLESLLSENSHTTWFSTCFHGLICGSWAPDSEARLLCVVLILCSLGGMCCPHIQNVIAGWCLFLGTLRDSLLVEHRFGGKGTLPAWWEKEEEFPCGG